MASTLRAGLAVVAFVVAAPALAGNPASGEIRYWFDRMGQPTADAVIWARAHGLPKFVQGVPFKYPLGEAHPGCVTMQFTVRPDGVTDQFLILDSRPKGIFDATALDAVKYWKFEKTEAGLHAEVPLLFGKDTETGSHIARWDHSCVLPRVQVLQPAGALKPDREVDPLYPPALVEARTQGCVAVSYAVRPDGLADDYDLVAAEPAKAFVSATMSALNKWHFAAGKPGQREQVTIRFTIPELGVEAPKCVAVTAKSGATKS